MHGPGHLVSPQRLLLVTLCFLTFLSSPAVMAEPPHADWRVVETQHFRIHYPIEYGPWASRVASRIESIRSAVVAEVGFDPQQRTDVVIVNPDAQPNGLTYPFLDAPRIVLYAESPDPDTQIGEFGDWIDLLVTHEVTHLVHLLRPSRNPAQRLLAHLLPVSPILLTAPRWVLEGYATMVEGRLTGGGRPPGTMRAAVLRKWAQNGRMPSYAQLQSDRRFLGMSMAYLAGSAFLEWLEERSGPGSLQKLWARLTARQKRSFEMSFEGVYGDSPQHLYGRFVAELTERAVSVDRETAADLREGTLWQETLRNSGDPVVSPDGKQIAVVLRTEKGPSRLVIWSTGPAKEEEEKLAKRLARIARRDPEDVPPLRSKPLPRKPLHELTLPDGGDIESPRWTADGASLIFAHRQRDRSGTRHRDLFRWTAASGAHQRLTYLADVGDADPIGGKTTAVAVRSRHGYSQLVTVDLSSGAITELTPPSLDRIYSHPRASRDGRTIAYAVHDAGRWQLARRDLTSGNEILIPTPVRSSASSPEWSRNSDDLFAVILAGGFAEVHRFPAEGTESAITRMSGAAFQPAPSPDGRLFFMSLEPEGFAVRLFESPAPATPRPLVARSLVPALPPAPAKGVTFANAEVPPARRYGLGHQRLGWILSENSAPSAHTTELGLHAGDLIGRLDTIAVAAFGNDRSQRGMALATAWRGWPVEVGARLFRTQEPLIDQRGLELGARWRSRFQLYDTDLEAAALSSRARLPNEPSRSRDIGLLRGAVHAKYLRANGSVDAAVSGGDVTVRDLAATTGVRLGGGISLQGMVRGAETGGTSRFLDQILVGGIATTVVPRTAIVNRILEPALPTAALSGTRYRGAGLSLSVGGIDLFYRTHRVRGGSRAGTGVGSGDNLAVAGIEIAHEMEPMPILNMTGLRITLGGARVMDRLAADRTQWWIGLRYQP